MAALHNPICVALIAVFLMAALEPPSVEAALSCNTVFGAFFGCLSVNGGVVEQCCGGVREIYRVATADDRQRVCYCLKAYAATFTVSTLGKLNDYGHTCNLNIPHITPTVDCSTVT